MTREREYEFEGGESGADLELDRTSHVAPRKAARFVSGIPAPEMGQCIYCEAARPLYGPCASCGHDAAGGAPGAEPSRGSSVIALAPRSNAAALAPPSVLESALDTLKAVPFGFWKRVPLYSFLVAVLGNTLLCGGLSARANIALGLLFVIGLAGMAASFVQRSP